MDRDKTLENLPLPGPVSPLFIKRVLEANDELIKLAVTLQNETTTGSRSDLQKVQLRLQRNLCLLKQLANSSSK
ncbi:hypothetical protein MP638_004948 [Amoeboaphelidium occidentale]|nr:hypothetical protein MP638_004948 [Amoeboaphelidium occidentale]